MSGVQEMREMGWRFWLGHPVLLLKLLRQTFIGPKYRARTPVFNRWASPWSRDVILVRYIGPYLGLSPDGRHKWKLAERWEGKNSEDGRTYEVAVGYWWMPRKLVCPRR